MTREEAIKICTREKECVQAALDACADGGHYVSPDGIITAADYVEAMDMAIAALREQPRWISVEERLPEESGRYIVLRKSGDCLDCCYEKERDSWGVLIDMGEAGALWVAYKGVTHWMPLPEPPEVEV